MSIKATLIFIEVIFVIAGFLASRGDGHGMFNGDIARTYPECGRKASKCFAVLQLIFLVLTCFEFAIFKPRKDVTIVSGVIGILVPMCSALIILHRLARKEMIKDEMDRKEQIRKEETTFM